MVWYLKYFTGARLTFLRDPFHRGWNDSSQALKRTGLWWVVLYTAIIANVADGPWNGTAIFNKIQGAAADFFAKTTLNTPFYQPKKVKPLISL